MDHCVTINLDDHMLRKVFGYNGQNISASFLAVHSVLWTDTHHLCFCGWKAVKQNRRRQWVSDRNKAWTSHSGHEFHGK